MINPDMVTFHSMLRILDIPPARFNDAGWLGRNLGISAEGESDNVKETRRDALVLFRRLVRSGELS